MSPLVALAPLLLAAGSSAATHCDPISDWEIVVSKKEIRWIVIGEVHGTAEVPAIFSDAVCLTAEARGPIIVGLEVPSTDQSKIDEFIGSDGGLVAKAKLLTALLWQMRGSVSTEAFVHLFERLRELHKEGRVARVVAFQDNKTPYDPSGGQTPYEEHLAAVVKSAAEPGATVMVLVGNLHARKTEVDFGRPFMPMASLLPNKETLTLNAIGNGGMAWNCRQDGCGPNASPSPAAPTARGVTLRSQLNGAYDGVLNLGVPTTASPPPPAKP